MEFQYFGVRTPWWVSLSAARVEVGAVLLVELARRRWKAARHRDTRQVIVGRIECASTAPGGGRRRELIIFTNAGVLVCSPATMLYLISFRLSR
jgi:hypothetical protein